MSNINISEQTCSIGPTEGLFYYINDSSLVSVNYDGDIISLYTKSSYTNPIKFISFACSSKSSFDYSGALVFTVEEGVSNVVFRRWVLDLNTISLKEVKAVSYNKLGYYSFDIRGFSIEKYIRNVAVNASVGQNYIEIDSTVHIKSGQECIIGPSTSETHYNDVTTSEVDYIIGNKVYLTESLDNSFVVGDYITFVGDLLVSSAVGISNGAVPIIYIMDSKGFWVKDERVLYQIRTISCSDFNNDRLYLCSNYCVYIINNTTYEVSNILYSYQHCNGYKQAYGIVVVSDEVFYTLQKDIVSFSNFNCSVESNSTYNLVINSFERYINSSQISFGSYVDSNKINVTAKILDQYAIPVYNVTARFKTSDSVGSFSNDAVITNISGEASTVYTFGDDITQVLTAYTNTTFAWRSSDYVYGNNYVNILGDVESRCFVSSYGDVTSSVVESFYSSVIDADGVIGFLQKLYIAHGNMGMIDDVTSTTDIYSMSDEIYQDIVVRLDAGYSIVAEGLVFNSLSAYTNYPLDDIAHVYMFEFLNEFLPECYSIKNSRSVIINLLISPRTYAFDISSFSFKIREINSIFNYDSGIRDVTADGIVTPIDLGGGRYSINFVYSPDPLYKFSSRIHCYLNVYDTDLPRNLIMFGCYFDIIPDYIPPTVVSISPACGAINVPKNVDVYAVISDGVGTGINPDTIELMLDGIPVIPAVYTISGGYSLSYHPVIDFNSGAGVSLNIKAFDYNDNLMSKSCKFYIEESNKPEIVPEDICADVVDNRFSLYFDVFDTGGGVKFDTVKLFLDNKDVDLIVKPVIKRIR
jgi:hypothetical protein